MDEIGNWIYIILMFVVLISSVFKSFTKKKEQQQAHIPVPEAPEEVFPFPPVPKIKTKKLPPPVPVQNMRTVRYSHPLPLQKACKLNCL